MFVQLDSLNRDIAEVSLIIFDPGYLMFLHLGSRGAESWQHVNLLLELCNPARALHFLGQCSRHHLRCIAYYMAWCAINELRDVCTLHDLKAAGWHLLRTLVHRLSLFAGHFDQELPANFDKLNRRLRRP